MPHIHLETTADLPENAHVPDILEALVGTLSGIATVNPAFVKAYHSLRSVWWMGEGAQPGFAQCTVSILKGREEDLRVEIADKMFATLREHFTESLAVNEVYLTLEVREMSPETYRK